MKLELGLNLLRHNTAVGSGLGALNWTWSSDIFVLSNGGNTILANSTSASEGYTDESCAAADMDVKFNCYNKGLSNNLYLFFTEESTIPHFTLASCQFGCGIRNDGRFSVIEYGSVVYLGGILTPEQQTQECEIINDSGTVKYYLGGALIYTSLKTPAGNYRLFFAKQGTGLNPEVQITFHNMS